MKVRITKILNKKLDSRNASKWKAEGGELGLLPILETALDNM